MKKMMLFLGLLMATSICVKGHNHYNNHVSISIQTFYDELAPYGEWIYTPDYGYAWRPYLDYNEDFRPYSTRGNWVYTDLGWTWVSEYRWGWATFHYGRWYFDDYFGWMWIPGHEWAPAWVTWGSYNDCWAWAPMGPNIYVNVYTTWRAPHFWWTFIPYRHFCSYNWHSYIYNRPVQVTNITYINNYYYGNDDRHNSWTWDYGPRVPDVERHTRTKVQKRRLVDTDKPGVVHARNARDNNVNVYRPEVTKEREKPKPSNFRTVDQNKINSRTSSTRTSPRTQPPKQRTTETTTKRHTETRVTPTRETSQQTNTKFTINTHRTNVKPPSRKPAPTRTAPSKKTTEVKKHTPPKSYSKPKANTPSKSHTQGRLQTPPKTQAKGKPKSPGKTRSK